MHTDIYDLLGSQVCRGVLAIDTCFEDVKQMDREVQALRDMDKDLSDISAAFGKLHILRKWSNVWDQTASMRSQDVHCEPKDYCTRDLSSLEEVLPAY